VEARHIVVSTHLRLAEAREGRGQIDDDRKQLAFGGVSVEMADEQGNQQVDALLGPDNRGAS
jgi:hypothetical protein